MLTRLRQKLDDQGEVYIKFKVNPGAGTTELKDKREDGVYKINVAAPPEKGKANRELVKFLAKQLGVAKNNVTIISGHGEKDKLIKIIK